MNVVMIFKYGKLFHFTPSFNKFWTATLKSDFISFDSIKN